MSAIAVVSAKPAISSKTPQVTTFRFAPTDTLSISLRAIVRDGEPWFLGMDVAAALGYANASDALTDHVDPEDKHSVSLGLPGRAPIIINESGLYSLILRSNKPEAKQFKRWVTKEVLPTIRKQGAYVQGADRLSPEAQDLLYATIRALLAEALRRYDRETEHVHWRGAARRREWFRLAAEKVSKEMGLPLNVVVAAGSRGLDAGMLVMTQVAL